MKPNDLKVSRRNLLKVGSLAAVLAGASVLTGKNPSVEVSTRRLGFSLGHVDAVYAGVTPDFLCNDSNAYERSLEAINSLPNLAGELVYLTGRYNFSSNPTLTRAIDNITIRGSGPGTYFYKSNGTPIFSAGVQSGWIFEKFATDEGGVDVVNASDYTISDVWIDGTRYNYPDYESRISFLEADLLAMLTLKSAEGTIITTGSEQNVVIVDSPSAVFWPVKCDIDLTSMQDGDTIEIKEYSKMKLGGEYLLNFNERYSNVQDEPKKTVPLGPNRYGFKVTIQQISGLYRSIDYQYFYED